jgi:hypothetical protein
LAVLPSTEDRTGLPSDIDLTLVIKYMQTPPKNLIPLAERKLLKPSWLLDWDEWFQKGQLVALKDR